MGSADRWCDCVCRIGRTQTGTGSLRGLSPPRGGDSEGGSAASVAQLTSGHPAAGCRQPHASAVQQQARLFMYQGTGIPAPTALVGPRGSAAKRGGRPWLDSHISNRRFPVRVTQGPATGVEDSQSSPEARDDGAVHTSVEELARGLTSELRT